jgi:hypothetical protein
MSGGHVTRPTVIDTSPSLRGDLPAMLARADDSMAAERSVRTGGGRVLHGPRCLQGLLQRTCRETGSQCVRDLPSPCRSGHLLTIEKLRRREALGLFHRGRASSPQPGRGCMDPLPPVRLMQTDRVV